MANDITQPSEENNLDSNGQPIYKWGSSGPLGFASSKAPALYAYPPGYDFSSPAPGFDKPLAPVRSDADWIIRTVAGETAPTGQNTAGQQAVAATILNRMRLAGRSAQDVVLEKNQFEPWATQKQRLEAIDPNSDAYKTIAKNIAPVLAGQDPTGGATHFYSPGAQKALGRDPPSWDNGTGQDFGGNLFFKLPYKWAGGQGHVSRIGPVVPNMQFGLPTAEPKIQPTGNNSLPETPSVISPLVLLALGLRGHKATPINYDPFALQPKIG